MLPLHPPPPPPETFWPNPKNLTCSMDNYSYCPICYINMPMPFHFLNQVAAKKKCGKLKTHFTFENIFSFFLCSINVLINAIDPKSYHGELLSEVKLQKIFESMHTVAPRSCKYNDFFSPCNTTISSPNKCLELYF